MPLRWLIDMLRSEGQGGERQRPETRDRGSMPNNFSLGKNSRLYFLGAVMLLWCVAICGRLVFLQIFSYGKFVKQAGHQQQRAIPLADKRGVIYDRAGHE